MALNPGLGGRNIEEDADRLAPLILRHAGTGHSHDFATRNVATGSGAETTGTDNVTMGNNAGANASSSSDSSVIIGSTSGPSSTATIQDSVFVGYKAGSEITTSSHTSNVGIGNLAGPKSGGSNVMVGSRSGAQISGTENVFVGARSGSQSDSIDNAVFIGYACGIQTWAASNQLIIDSNSGTSALREPLIYGEFDDRNFGLNTRDMASGAGVIAIADATTAPSGTPSGGGILYVDSGALKYKGSSGTVTTIANA